MINNRNKNITSQVKNDRISRRKGAIPILLSAVTNNVGDEVIMSFNTKMKSPVGKEGEFSLKDIVAIDNTYQKWEGYPDSPVLTSEFPYQCISNDYYKDGDLLFVSTSKLKYLNTQPQGYSMYQIITGGATGFTYELQNGAWVQIATNPSLLYAYEIKEQNCDIYTDGTMTTVYSAKTTPDYTITPINLSGLALDTDTKKIVASVFTTEGLYQKWEGYPDSPSYTTSYPYQLIMTNGTDYGLFLSTGKFYKDGNTIKSTGVTYGYRITNENWLSWFGSQSIGSILLDLTSSTLLQANADIYTDSALTTTYFAKTTKSVSPAITNGQTIKLDYTQGTVASSEGDKLKSFAGVEVENVAGYYQRWEGYQSSPLLTSVYPYQAITSTDTKAFLLLSTIKIYTVPDVSYPSGFISGNGKLYSIDLPITNPTWNFVMNTVAGDKVRLANQLEQANNPVYTDEFYGTIYFEKTTT